MNRTSGVLSAWNFTNRRKLRLLCERRIPVLKTTEVDDFLRSESGNQTPSNSCVMALTLLRRQSCPISLPSSLEGPQATSWSSSTSREPPPQQACAPARQGPPLTTRAIRQPADAAPRRPPALLETRRRAPAPSTTGPQMPPRGPGNRRRLPTPATCLQSPRWPCCAGPTGRPSSLPTCAATSCEASAFTSCATRTPPPLQQQLQQQAKALRRGSRFRRSSPASRAARSRPRCAHLRECQPGPPRPSARARERERERD
jgi:hypothetical protein